jgi:hypothetical protein
MSLAGLSLFRPKPRAYTAVRIVLGVLLLTAASLKIAGLAIDPWSQESVLWSLRVQVAAVEVESVLGLWLLSGWSLRTSWLLCLAFFASMAAISIYLVLEGQESCGCFGQIMVNPWLTFFLDLGAVALLLFCRPESSGEVPSGIRARTLKTAVVAGPILILILGAFLVSADKDVAGMLAQLRGESITVEPPVTYVGEGRAGDVRNFTIELTNHAAHAIHCIGGTTSCSCIATRDFPVELRPAETRPIQVTMRFRGGGGLFQHRFVFYTDDDKQSIVVARFAGRVDERID